MGFRRVFLQTRHPNAHEGVTRFTTPRNLPSSGARSNRATKEQYREETMTETPEIYAIRYASHDGRTEAQNYIGGDPHQTSEPLDFYVWAIKSANGTVLVDTGFDAAMAKKRGRTLLKPIADGLLAIGIKPDEVSDIIITHLHYDHAGNYDLFPRARYHLQDCEMAYATGRCMCDVTLRTPFEADDVTAMVRKVFSDRVTFHEGDDTIAPGITVHHIGGHSKGLQSVRVETARGAVVLASDASHLYGHLEQRKVFPIVYQPDAVVAGYDKLKTLAASERHIVPGHDSKVFVRYPAAALSLKGWIARLDVDPLE
jgi:glyoxylase-like metal-dependent hydrolase (beta-lactamase superfamily II)